MKTQRTLGQPHILSHPVQPPIRGVQALYETLSLFTYYVGAPVFFIPDEDHSTWYQLVHGRQDAAPIDFEDEYGGRFEREKYNQRNMNLARVSLKPVIRRRNGLMDFCVPVFRSGECLGCVISGAIQDHLMDRKELESHFQKITQQYARENPVQFSRYVRGILSQPYVAHDMLRVFASSLELVAAALCSSRRPDEILKDTARFRYRYFTRRYLHEGWLDSLIWRKFHKMELELRRGPETTPWERSEIGIGRIPSVVMAATPGSSFRDNADHVDFLLAAQRLKESSFRLARKFPNTVSGGAEEFGTVLFTSPRPGINESVARIETRELAAAIARKLEKELHFPIHIGIGRIEPWGLPLERSYHEAIHSMMWAAYSKLHLFPSWDTPPRDPDGVSEPEELIHQMVAALRGGSRTRLDTARDLYWQAVLSLCGRRPELLQAYFRNVIGIMAYFLEREININEETVRALSNHWVSQIAITDNTERQGALFRNMLDEFYRLRMNPKDSMSRVSLEQWVTRLRKRCDQPIRLREAAGSVGMSIPVFCRKFKAFTGRSFIDYVNLVRIEKSKHLLATTTLTVAQISREMGFNATSYFIRVFRKLEGTSPSQYREKLDRQSRRAVPNGNAIRHDLGLGHTTHS